MLRWIDSPLVGDSPTSRERGLRLLLFLVWCVLVGWLLSGHVFWRDEVRALSLALSGSNFFEMLRNVQGEGHPALWYLLLRAAHEIAPYREVLPFVAAAVGFATMALVTFRAPFRIPIIGIILFSYYGAFEYVVVARNYGIAALLMFLIAATYGRTRNRLWFGVLVAVLANTNVPGCILAGCFVLLRLLELSTDRSATRRDWILFCGNAAIAAIGAALCFVAVYPPVNDGAVSANLSSLSIGNLGAALIDGTTGFRKMSIWPPLVSLLLLCSCLAFVRKPPVLVAAIVGFVLLKLFFYFVYTSDYRHEALFLVFLLSLHWIVATEQGSKVGEEPAADVLRLVGRWTFVALLVLQSALLVTPVLLEVKGTRYAQPYSQSANLARLLQRPEFRSAIVMADSDVMLEPLAYYVDNPLWLAREQRFGKVARLIKNSRSEMTLDDVLADAMRLHSQTGRPVVYVSVFNMRKYNNKRYNLLFHNYLTVTPENHARFLASTRFVARLRPALTDEYYDVYVYPPATAPAPRSPPEFLP